MYPICVYYVSLISHLSISYGSFMYLLRVSLYLLCISYTSVTIHFVCVLRISYVPLMYLMCISSVFEM